ncbi:MAG: alpha/beta hydrolase [Quadrisphaera sp.]
MTAPTLVVHGDHDVMVHASGGAATAAAIAGSRHVVVPGMGHLVSSALVERLVSLVGDHVASAAAGAAEAVGQEFEGAQQ